MAEDRSVSSDGKPKIGETAKEIRARGWIVHHAIPNHAVVSNHLSRMTEEEREEYEASEKLGVFQWPKGEL